MSVAIGVCIRCVVQAEEGIRDPEMSRGLGDVYKRQDYCVIFFHDRICI
ncbi:hypothetical protein IBD95_00195 [Francisella tularensis]|nr:hypothetical protein [Francisella tularensis]